MKQRNGIIMRASSSNNLFRDWLVVIMAPVCTSVRSGAVSFHVHLARFARTIMAPPAGTPLKNLHLAVAFSFCSYLFLGTCLLVYISEYLQVSKKE